MLPLTYTTPPDIPTRRDNQHRLFLLDVELALCCGYEKGTIIERITGTLAEAACRLPIPEYRVSQHWSELSRAGLIFGPAIAAIVGDADRIHWTTTTHSEAGRLRFGLMKQVETLDQTFRAVSSIVTDGGYHDMVDEAIAWEAAD